MEASADDVYPLKRIVFGQRPVQIVLQNLNGPCPLLAITNVLLLSGKLTLHEDRNHVSYRHLIEMLGEFLFTQQHVESEAQQLTRQATISATLGLLPRLCHGLDVNVGFDGTESFEYTQELACFDAFGVALRHGLHRHSFCNAMAIRRPAIIDAEQIEREQITAGANCI